MIALVDIKERLGITSSDYDNILVDMEAGLLAWIERQTGRYFGPIETIETLVLLGRGSRNLWLPERPWIAYDGVAATAADLTVLERAYPSGTETAIIAAETTGFFLRKTETRSMLVRRPGHIWEFYYEYEVSVTEDDGFTRGYETGDEPLDIRELLFDLLKLKWDRRQKVTGLRSETIGGYSYSLGSIGDDDLDQIPTGRATLKKWTNMVYAT